MRNKPRYCHGEPFLAPFVLLAALRRKIKGAKKHCDSKPGFTRCNGVVAHTKATLFQPQPGQEI